MCFIITFCLLKSNRGNECSNKFVVKQAVALSLSLFQTYVAFQLTNPSDA
jgi:hypothetical protein